MAKAVGHTAMPVMNEFVKSFAVEIDAAIVSAYPHISLPVAVNRINRIIGKAAIIDIILGIGGEHAGLRVKDAQSAILGPNPHIMCIVFGQ